MPQADASDYETAAQVLAEFASTGYAKTSMTSLAEAAGVARQTIYNRFGRKEAVLEWAIGAVVRSLRADAFACLEDPQRPTEQALLDAFCCWLGPVVRFVRDGRYGEEILGLGNAARRRAGSYPLDAFTSEVTGALLTRGVRQQRREAADLAFVLVMAAKGLLADSETEADFRTGMARALRGAGINSSSE
ncbi:MAG: TetR/AcrR family transcriptional regulator [Holophagales bacterium]|nr:TetR/AcrR family transcriptional regulator [Holophagales bacterium]MYG32045.1 TetR/AcrR family transcriptional regulator [Holophagales bacterium]MYI80469.1 TetR/AcrR family transcriptional regulator [Holophagales bacterium]